MMHRLILIRHSQRSRIILYVVDILDVPLIFPTPAIVMDTHRWVLLLPLRCDQLPRSRGDSRKGTC